MMMTERAGISVGRAALGVLAAWMALVVAGNSIDALVVLGALPATTPFASGNFHQISEQLGRVHLSGFAGLLFAGAIAIELAATVILVRAVFRRDDRSEDLAFALLIALFGGFVLFDELCGAFSTEATHRNLVVFVAVLYLVVRVER